MADIIYHSWFQRVAQGDFDADTDTLYCLLAGNSYTPDADHDVRDDLSDTLTATGDYLAVGKALTGLTITVDDANNRVDIEADDVNFGNANLTARYAIIYEYVDGNSANDRLVACLDLTGSGEVTRNPFVVQFTSGVVLRYQQGTQTIYSNFYNRMLSGDFDVDTDNIYVLLCTNSYTPNPDHDSRSDLTNTVAATGDYAAEGEQLTTVVLSLDDTNDLISLGADDVDFGAANLTARYAIVYEYVDGTAGNDQLMVCLDLVGSATDVTRNPFVIEWTNGLIMTLAQG